MRYLFAFFHIVVVNPLAVAALFDPVSFGFMFCVVVFNLLAVPFYAQLLFAPVDLLEAARAENKKLLLKIRQMDDTLFTIREVLDDK